MEDASADGEARALFGHGWENDGLSVIGDQSIWSSWLFRRRRSVARQCQAACLRQDDDDYGDDAAVIGDHDGSQTAVTPFEYTYAAKLLISRRAGAVIKEATGADLLADGTKQSCRHHFTKVGKENVAAPINGTSY